MDVREKLVELLKTTPTRNGYTDLKDIADHLIANSVTVQGDKDINVPTKWISVTERLPDEHESLFARYKGTDKWSNAMFTTISDRVIVCAEYENGERIVKTANTIEGNWKVKDSFYPCRVTHWMPFPQPPKGE